MSNNQTTTATEQPNLSHLEGYDTTNVVPFDPDFRKRNSIPPSSTDTDISVSEKDPLVFARRLCEETGTPYTEILVTLYNSVIESMERSGDNPEMFLELLEHADIIKEELIRERVI